MPILTKPAITKGTPASFSLDKVALKALVSDSYYMDENNWKKVVMMYESSSGGQKVKAQFNAALTTPTGAFKVSARARDAFNIKEIIIYDYDGGYYVIPRSALTVSEFDISLVPQGPTLAINQTSAVIIPDDGGYPVASITSGSGSYSVSSSNPDFSVFLDGGVYAGTAIPSATTIITVTDTVTGQHVSFTVSSSN